MTGGRFRQADAETPDMHLHAIALQQAAVKLRRIDFLPRLLGRQQLDLGIDFLADQFTGARQPFVVHRLGGQLELAVALEVASNLLLLHQRHDALHGAFIGLVIRPSLVGAEAGGECRVILGHAGTAMPAVAP